MGKYQGKSKHGGENLFDEAPVSTVSGISIDCSSSVLSFNRSQGKSAKRSDRRLPNLIVSLFHIHYSFFRIYIFSLVNQRNLLNDRNLSKVHIRGTFLH